MNFQQIHRQLLDPATARQSDAFNTHREAVNQDASDGRCELLQAQTDAFEAIAPIPQLIEVDSSAAVDYNVQQILCRLLTR